MRMQQSNMKRQMSHKKDGHGDDSPVFPEMDHLSNKDDQELTAAETL